MISQREQVCDCGASAAFKVGTYAVVIEFFACQGKWTDEGLRLTALYAPPVRCDATEYRLAAILSRTSYVASGHPAKRATGELPRVARRKGQTSAHGHRSDELRVLDIEQVRQLLRWFMSEQTHCAKTESSKHDRDINVTGAIDPKPNRVQTSGVALEGRLT